MSVLFNFSDSPLFSLIQKFNKIFFVLLLALFLNTLLLNGKASAADPVSTRNLLDTYGWTKTFGVDSYKTAKSIKSSNKNNIRGVTEVFERKYKGGVLVIDVKSTLSGASLAEKITSIKAGKKLRVTGTTKNTINLKRLN